MSEHTFLNMKFYLMKDKGIAKLKVYSQFSNNSIQTFKNTFVHIKLLKLYDSYISFSKMCFLVAWQMLVTTNNKKNTPLHNPH